MRWTASHDHAVVEYDEERVAVELREDDTRDLVQRVVCPEEEDEVDDRGDRGQGARLDREAHDCAGRQRKVSRSACARSKWRTSAD